MDVSLSREQGSAIIQVNDTGRGIPAEALPRIFKPFFTTRSEGTGLGLSLANSIVQSHGGRIEITSAAAEGHAVQSLASVDRPKGVKSKPAAKW